MSIPRQRGKHSLLVVLMLMQMDVVPDPSSKLNPGEIYPESTSSTAPGPKAPNDLDKPEAKFHQHSLFGVPVIATAAIFYGAYNAWIAYEGARDLPVVILALSILQIILGIGLLARREVARIFAIFLEAIGAIVNIAGLLGATILTVANIKTSQIAAIPIQLLVVIYLTRPSVREYFD